MGRWFTSIVLAAGVSAPTARSASLALVPIDAFGRVLDSCSLESFRKASSTKDKPQEYQSKFHHLTGRELPLGRYEAAIRCGDSLLSKDVQLNSEDQIELVAREERVMISEPTKPTLSVEMDQSGASGETWWVSFVGLYNGERFVSPLSSGTGKFVVTDPEPGSYLVTVESDRGYSCGQRVDLIEFTRVWRFDPRDCSFRLDEFAHLVKGHSKENDPWYPAMKARRDQFFNELREAARRDK